MNVVDNNIKSYFYWLSANDYNIKQQIQQCVIRKSAQKEKKAYGDSFHIIEYEVSDDSYELNSLILVTFDGIDEDGRVKVGKRQVLFQRN